MLLKDARKVIRIGKADLGRDLLHRITSTDEVRGALVHFQAGQHFMRTFPDETIEEAGKISGIEMGPLGQLRDGHDRAEMHLQLSPAPLETLPGPAMGLRRGVSVFLDAQGKQLQQQSTEAWRQAAALESGLQHLLEEVVDWL